MPIFLPTAWAQAYCRNPHTPPTCSGKRAEAGQFETHEFYVAVGSLEAAAVKGH